eukprot:m.44073 g.44073  ORF g.44073 m.44073 type:complete len:602 (+) comp12990_c0_seq4:116-1921(+)
MLSELLAALMGFDGDVFVFNDRCDLSVRAGLPFVSSLEEAVLNRICRVGGYFKKLENYVLEHRSGQKGAYLAALAIALDRHLDDYRDLVTSLDELVVQGEDITLSRIQHAIGSEEEVFEMLHLQLEEIQADEIQGCAIITRLVQVTANGNPLLADIYQHMLQACELVFLRQLSAWLSQGLLHDLHNEFFIRRGSQVSTQQDDQVDTRKPVWDMYTLDLARLPSLLPVPLATKILNTGRTLLLLRDEVNSLNAGLLQDEQSAEETILDLMKHTPLKTWHIEACIKTISYRVHEQLWQTLAQRDGLLSAMKTVKDFVLLGRGELFNAFLEQSERLLFKPVINTSDFDIKAAFNRALTDVGLQDSLEAQHVQMSVSTPDNDNPQTDVTVLNNLRLNWSSAWPTQLLFTADNLTHYTELFSFLFRLRYVQKGLQRSWSALMNHHQRRTGVHQANSGLWTLRMHMASFVDSLYSFLQADVYEPAYVSVVKDFEQADNFEDILQAHDKFVSTLRQQSFQSMPTILKVLNEVLRCCDRLVELMVQNSDLSLILSTDVTAIDEAFRRQAAFLYRVLNSVSDRKLAQLLLRIDFNQVSLTSSTHLHEYVD